MAVQWTPRQAAERQVDAAVLFLERLDVSAQARRGLHRLCSIANAHGRPQVGFAGISLGGLAPSPPRQHREDNVVKKDGKSKKRKPRKKTEVRKNNDREALDRKWEERRVKEQQQQALAAATDEVPKVPPGPVARDSTPPGLLVSQIQGASSTPKSTAVLATFKQPEPMDDTQVFHFLAGAKHKPPPSPDAAKAIAKIRAQKLQREGSPEKAMNPNATAFQPSASAERSVQQIGAAAFTGTFSWPASSSSTSQNGSGAR